MSEQVHNITDLPEETSTNRKRLVTIAAVSTLAVVAVVAVANRLRGTASEDGELTLND